MKQQLELINRPQLKTRGLSTHHLDIFEYILMGRSNREINRILGYSKRSHAVVDHSRKVMYKLLSFENLSRKMHTSHVVFPRDYCFWWKSLLDKHREQLLSVMITPLYYENE